MYVATYNIQCSFCDVHLYPTAAMLVNLSSVSAVTEESERSHPDANKTMMRILFSPIIRKYRQYAALHAVTSNTITNKWLCTIHSFSLEIVIINLCTWHPNNYFIIADTSRFMLNHGTQHSDFIALLKYLQNVAYFF